MLRICLRTELNLVFGRFKGGSSISLPAGDYVYVGSAMSRCPNHEALAHRLIRHACRSDGKRSQEILPKLVTELTREGLLSPARRATKRKNVFWHIDFLLDTLVAELHSIIALRSGIKLEAIISNFLSDLSATTIIKKGLGASDSKNGTHLLRVTDATEDWWHDLSSQLEDLIKQSRIG